MARSSSGIPHLLVLVALIAAGWFIYNRIQQPQPRHRHREEHRHERRNEFGSRQQIPSQREQAPAACDLLGVSCASHYFRTWTQPAMASCRTRIHNGFPVPDRRCTPGGINPSVSADVLRDPRWRTSCVRNCQSSEAGKHVTYDWYGLPKPRDNSGEQQVCELDHLVPLELGGSDGLGNIWPECGPSSAALQNRYFKIKDRVENYLADEVRSGRISLDAAQHGIASDWTQYLAAANRYCQAGGNC